MTQGRDGISLAPRGARKFMGIARRLSVVTAMLAVAALLASTGTSFAKSKKSTSSHNGLLDSVTLSNYGSAFSGSIETFAAGAGATASPKLWVKGGNTLLGIGTGPEGINVSSSSSHHVAITIPIDLLDFTGFGAAAGLSTHAGTGFVEIFSGGANGNSAPESIIGTPNVSFGVPNTTAIDIPQGVAFEDPFDGINPGREILAVTNTLPTVIGPDSGEAICAAPPAGAGFSVGTVTEYDVNTLGPGINSIVPFNNNPVTALDDTTGDVISANATIGGCLSFLLGPVADAFDETGFLFVVNEAAVSAGGPGFVSVYEPGAAGDVFPSAVVGLLGPTAGDFVDPARVAVSSDSDFFDDIIFVTDVGDNSIKIFAPFTNFSDTAFLFQGTKLAEIQGGSTKLKRPEGVALGMASGALYVVNNNKNSLEMFTDVGAIVESGGGNIAPTLIIEGKKPKMNFPVDVAIAGFTPSASPTETISGDR